LSDLSSAPSSYQVGAPGAAALGSVGEPSERWTQRERQRHAAGDGRDHLVAFVLRRHRGRSIDQGPLLILLSAQLAISFELLPHCIGHRAAKRVGRGVSSTAKECATDRGGAGAAVVRALIDFAAMACSYFASPRWASMTNCSNRSRSDNGGPVVPSFITGMAR
jgi:hypothetical protein